MRNAKDFLASAGEQIRWKRARTPLLRELEDHITDRREALAAEGVEPAEAEERAVLEMGDPVEIGVELDRVHRPAPNWTLIGCAAALLAAGLALMWALGDRETYMASMVTYTLLGAAALVGGYFLDYTLLAKCPRWVLFAASGLCVVGCVLGNRFMSAAAQLCYFLPVLFIPFVYRARSGEKRDAAMLIYGGAACVAAAVLGASWMSLGIYILVVCLGMVVFAAAKGWLGQWKRRVLLWCFVPPTVVFALLYTVSADSLNYRLMAGAINPESDPMGMGWVPLRLRELIATSRLFGQGQTGELLESFIARNDICSVESLLAVASHQFGLIVFIAVAALAVAMGVVIIRGIRRQSCLLGSLTLLTVGLSFGLRALAYFAANLGFNLFWFEGLPLFSYCGKLMVLDMLATGLVLSVFRTGSISRDTSAPRIDPVAG